MRCLLCSFPLLLHRHHHHILPYEDGGPDHFVNLIALCPNHHVVLEQIRRYIAPRHTHSAEGWSDKAQAALHILEGLDERTKMLMNRLTEPNDLMREFRGGGIPPHLHRAFAHELAQRSAKLLKDVNLARPEILVLQNVRIGRYNLPKLPSEWQLRVAEVEETLAVETFGEVLTLYLQRLGLPHDFDFKREFDHL